MMNKKKMSLTDARKEKELKMMLLLESILSNQTDRALAILDEVDAKSLNKHYSHHLKYKTESQQTTTYAVELAAQNGQLNVLKKILQKPGIEFYKAAECAIAHNHFDALLMLKLYGAPINPKKISKAITVSNMALSEDKLLSILKSLDNIDSALNEFAETKQISLSKMDYVNILELFTLSNGIDYITAKLDLLKQSHKHFKLDIKSITQQINKSIGCNSSEMSMILQGEGFPLSEEDVITTSVNTSAEVQPIGSTKTTSIFESVD